MLIEMKTHLQCGLLYDNTRITIYNDFIKLSLFCSKHMTSGYYTPVRNSYTCNKLNPSIVI